ncbi:MAG: outer membrane lipoprotein carrier protein LolA [Candidatus Zixiibacteriota bacterium]
MVEKTEAVYAKNKTFSVKFTQVVASGDFFDDDKSSGAMLLSYPEKFRVETPEQTLVSDGDSLWTYSVENKQVTIEPMDRLEDVVTPADYLFRFKEHYELSYDSIATIAKQPYHQISLKSKDDSQYVRSMKVLIDTETSLVRRVIYRDMNDNNITLDFKDWKLGETIAPTQFRFKTPSGVEEVRVP